MAIAAPPPNQLSATNVPQWLRELHVIDVDAHFTEPWDLWTSHAPKEYKSRVPHVEMVDGTQHWVIDGLPLGTARAVSVILPDGSKAPALRITDLTPDQVHTGSGEVPA